MENTAGLMACHHAEPVTIGDIAKRHGAWVASVGWNVGTPLEKIAMITSEIGEAVNECRGLTPTENFGEELADIILRSAYLTLEQGFDIQVAVYDLLSRHVCVDKDQSSLTLTDVANYPYDWSDLLAHHEGRVLEKLAMISLLAGLLATTCMEGKPSKELNLIAADIIWRITDIASEYGIDIQSKVISKIEKNIVRGTRGRVI